ncbi:MAG: hypothetical protein JWM68_816 [Verrucomicrobiales bacterium]|nr:hypothetical protein [Verrucomicrobiales bacterium]
MKTIQLAFTALTLAAFLTGSGCLVGHERTYSRGAVYEPAGADVYRGDGRYDRYDHRYPEGRSYNRDYRRDGYYDERGFWHSYQYRR